MKEGLIDSLAKYQRTDDWTIKVNDQTTDKSQLRTDFSKSKLAAFVRTIEEGRGKPGKQRGKTWFGLEK